MIKKVAQYYMNVSGRWIKWSAIFAGCAFFLLFIYHFVMHDFLQYDPWTWFSQVILPLAMFVGLFVLVRGICLQDPLPYAILGAIFCVQMILWSFASRDALLIGMSCVYYIAVGALMILTALGYLPKQLFSAAAVAVALVYRIVVRDAGLINNPDVDVLLPELAVLCSLASLLSMSMGMKKYK